MPSVSPSSAASTPPATLTLARQLHPETDLEVKRSHFLARAARTDSEEEARAFIASVRAAHPTARHHCSAFIVSVPGALPVERSSDDGEPSGTAGQPMLEVLRGTGLTNTTVVVTRYFGGTLLGTGGLVRAYSDAAAQGLAAASQVRLVTRYLWDVRVSVTDAGRLEADLRAHPDLSVEETIWGPTHAVVLLATDSPNPAPLAELLASLTQGEAVPEPAGSAVVELPV
ncbi:MAG: YigZ family protein [Actinomyces urogenitalis]|uniref:IMPACT family protein n=1 Tax=Actinomyces urogenitalis TaxID=103621 RepID=UPI0024308A1D|nr:YigZ family protein [Actinomyces urogenitalis]MCI7456002.1 YigZ family protein [Actinomyces urogenitalis]MDY3677970.1 YigZ family protein [Actinomyces urogenitalis]